MRRTFVIGDVHGHATELVGLLAKAGFLRPDGTDPDPGADPHERTAYSDEVVQLGDLGHYGGDTRDGDLACWQLAATYPWFHVLVGNHEMALLSELHRFRGQATPHSGLFSLIAAKNPQYAMERFGYLLTHAGLHEHFYDPKPKMSVKLLSELLQIACTEPDPMEVRDNIGSHRGGRIGTSGGILWRDDREPLADLPQVYGHSRGMIREQFTSKGESAICIDTMERHSGTLTGIWLPERKIVAFGPDAEVHETPSLRE